MLTKKMKRVLGIILTLAMCLALLPNVVFAEEPKYYVVGNMTNWKTNEAYRMTNSTGDEGAEYVLKGVLLSQGDEFKIVETNSSIQGFEPVWYPNGFDNNYIVNAGGIYDIYFRPYDDGGDDWFYNCIYVTPNTDVTGVTLDKAEITLKEGETETLTATVLPESAENKTVTWTSSDEAVATIDENGVVTAVSAGTADITVTTDEGGYTASCTVTVTAESTFYVVGSMTDWQTNEAYRMTNSTEAEGVYVLKSVALSRDDQFKIVETNDSIQDFEDRWYPEGTGNNYGENGEITAGGVYDIYFRPNYDGWDDWFYNCIYVTPNTDVTGVTLDKSGITLEEGETESLTATVLPENAENKTVTWTSSDEDVATIDENGVVTAVSQGTAVITVTTDEGGYTASCTVTVTEETNNNEEDTFTFFLTDNYGWGTGYVYAWDSSGASLTGNWPGTEIRSTLTNQFGEQTFAVTVPKETAGVIVNNGNGSQTDAITDFLFIYNGIYMHDTVNDLGGYIIGGYDCDLGDLTGVTLDKAEITLKEGETETLTATVYPPNAENKAVTWTSSDEAVATVADGVVTAVSEGTAVITVTTDEGGYTASCSVKVTGTKFYVVGNMTEWQTNEAYRMTKSTEAEGVEYVLKGVSLSRGDEFKIVVDNGSIYVNWNPEGNDNNYIVNADGVYDIYFRPDYDGGEDWFYACIYATLHVETNNTCGENLTWTLDDEGTLTISGTGDMANYDLSSPAPWNSSSASIKTIVIDDGATSIGDYAFYWCNSMTGITIPNSVTSIGEGAFLDCIGLPTVTIPDSVTSIGKYAFNNCDNLTTVTIGGGVASIGDAAFEECDSLTDVYYMGTEADWNKISIGDRNAPLTNATRHYVVKSGTCGENLTWTLEYNGTLTISGTGDMANYDIFSPAPWNSLGASIKTVVIDDGVTSIGENAFSNCRNLTAVTIGSGVTSIGYRAFHLCESLTSITIPDRVISIGGYAFWHCINLTSITIPDSVISIGDSAFEYCSSLTTVTIGSGVTSIDKYAFTDCSSLTDVYYKGTEEAWNKISISGFYNNYLINATRHYVVASGTCGENLTWMLEDNGTLTISGTGDMTNYGEDFPTWYFPTWYSSRLSIKTVVIDDGVTSIGNYAFYECSGLTSITIPDSVTSIGNYAFYHSGLTAVTIPDSVTSIGYGAFYSCKSLESITIPAGVTNIEQFAFAYCSSLTAVTIGKGVTNISRIAFWYCNNLTDVYYMGTEEDWNKISIDGSNDPLKNAKRHYMIYGTDTYWTLDSKGTLYISGSGAMANYEENSSLWYNNSSIIAVEIADGVTSIGKNTFSGCSNLTSIIIPKSVETIEKAAFDDCENLTDVYFRGTVEEWDGILKRKNNDDLIYARRHYLSPASSGTGQDKFSAILNKIGNNLIVTANVPDMDITKNVHAALYSDNGTMLDYFIYPAEYSNNTVHFMFKEVADLSYIKVFLWNGFESMTPLAESIVLDVDE